MNRAQIANDYLELINLRNRLHHEGSGEVFEEDHLLLDRILDVIEKILE